jgi:hypothetical protein
MKRIWTLLVAATLALCFGVGQAAAEESDPGAAQAAGQSAASGQEADGSGGAYQGGATNRAFDIRVLSPGSSGDVTQSNSTTAVGIAANDNDTKQDTDQTQAGGGSGSDYTQVAGQGAKSTQDADADATAKQIAPTNEAFSIRVLSPGSNGDVTSPTRRPPARSLRTTTTRSRTPIRRRQAEDRDPITRRSLARRLQTTRTPTPTRRPFNSIPATRRGRSGFSARATTVTSRSRTARPLLRPG